MANLVIYHANCFDGFGAAWVAKRALPGGTQFLPAKYGDPLPEPSEGDEVFILDFSYPKMDLIKMADAGCKVVVLDHHKTAEANLKDLSHDRIFSLFDMNRSGAGLTWDYFNPKKPRPALINYIEDRDIWRWALPHSREISAVIASYPRNMESYDHLDTYIENGFWEAQSEGAGILRYETQKVEEICQEVQFVDVAGHVVPAVNCPYVFGSLCGERLNTLYADYPFSAYYFDRADAAQQWGLRSTGFDVSEVAKTLGGGGHQRASGFVKGKVTRE
jgi:hypothetical protein